MFIQLARKRRSIRRFLKKEVETDKIDLLIEAALLSPSSRGLSPWEFIIVKDRDILDRLSRAKEHGSAFLKDADLGFVVCADPDRCDVWIEDASIASAFIHMAAESMGLGSCWIQIRKRMHNKTVTSEEYVSDILNIPERLNVLSIVAAGYPDEEKPPYPVEGLQFQKVHLECFGTPYKGGT
jgi:nitroreductase